MTLERGLQLQDFFVDDQGIKRFRPRVHTIVLKERIH